MSICFTSIPLSHSSFNILALTHTHIDLNLVYFATCIGPLFRKEKQIRELLVFPTLIIIYHSHHDRNAFNEGSLTKQCMHHHWLRRVPSAQWLFFYLFKTGVNIIYDFCHCVEKMLEIVVLIEHVFGSPIDIITHRLVFILLEKRLQVLAGDLVQTQSIRVRCINANNKQHAYLDIDVGLSLTFLGY